jgi:outer membrane protein TolC
LIAPPVPGGLTADMVAVRAVQTSPGLRADDEERIAQGLGVTQARANFIPRLSGQLRYARRSREESGLPGPNPVNYYESQASLDVPLSDYVLRLPQLYEAARKNARAAALLLDANRLQTASDARVAYYDWVKARLQQQVAERSLQRVRTHLGDAQTALSLGTASNADLLSVEAQVASAELSLARAFAATQVYSRRLGVLMHEPAPVSYEVGEDVNLPSAPAPSTAPDAEALLLQRALDRRLELQVISENASAQRERASAALAAELPRLDASASASYSRPNSRIIPPVDEFRGSWELGVRLSWSPTDLIGSEVGRQVSIARARQLDAQRAELVDGIALEVKSALTSLEESEVRVRTSERALASASESYRVRRELFKNGRATSAELTDAETEWSRAQLDAVSARVDRRIARVKLAHAVGEDIDGSLENSSPAKRGSAAEGVAAAGAI